jgi:hypothetical protein
LRLLEAANLNEQEFLVSFFQKRTFFLRYVFEVLRAPSGGKPARGLGIVGK